jgi:SAM-dependent methyltransferase
MPLSLRPGWRWLDLADGRRAIWSDRTGRHLPVSADLLDRLASEAPLPPALRARLDDLADEHDILVDRVVCRSAYAMVLIDRKALWHALPHQRGAGGFAWRSTALSSADLRVHLAVNNSRTVLQLAQRTGLGVEAVLAALSPFFRAEQPAYQLRRTPPRPRDRSLHHLVAPARPAGHRRADHFDAAGATTLGAWHEDGITDATTHFDDVETTFAHAFARPHPALEGEPYGARLYDRLVRRGLLPEGATVLEVGPGTGQVARDLLDADQAADRPRIRRYIRLDRSPVLLAAQNELVPESEGIHGDATSPPLPDASVDLLLSNEVLADLPAVPWTPHADGPVGERVVRYGLSVLPGPGPYNLGAWQLVEAGSRLLKPGGAMVLTEFGAVDEVPTETRQLNHPEVSIHFRHLALVAAGCGLHAQLEPVADLLDVQPHTAWLSRASWEGIRALFRAEQRHVEARAWTAATVPRLTRVAGLVDVPITEDGPAPVLQRLWALVARRPDEAL